MGSGVGGGVGTASSLEITEVAEGSAVPLAAQWRAGNEVATARPAAAEGPPRRRSPEEPPLTLASVSAGGAVLCVAGRELLLRRAPLPAGEHASACEFRLSAPATSYAPTGLWARPPRGRGFLFLPLKDIVDQVYSVYFHVSPDLASLPAECSMLRFPWSDAQRVPAASRRLARRVLATTGAQWGGAHGVVFKARGELQTPWNTGQVPRGRRLARPASTDTRHI